MSTQGKMERSGNELGFFGKYLTVWVILCILAGIGLGRIAPGVAQFLDGLEARRSHTLHQLGGEALHHVRHRDFLPRLRLPGSDRY